MLDHLADAAMSWWSLVIVAVASTANAAVAALVAVVGAEINDGVLASATLFVLATGTGIIGWALVVIVKLSNIVSRLEVTTEDHERRLSSGGL